MCPPPPRDRCPPVHDVALLLFVARHGVYAPRSLVEEASPLHPTAVLKFVTDTFGQAAAAGLPSPDAAKECLAQLAAQFPSESTVCGVCVCVCVCVCVACVA